MPCKCHGKQGIALNGKVPPDSPCTLCAYKHLNMALAAWGEFTYERDNRDWVASHVRLAVEHLKREQRNLALRVRDLATAIEMAEDTDHADIAASLLQLKNTVRNLFDIDHPDVLKRLENLKEN